MERQGQGQGLNRQYRGGARGLPGGKRGAHPFQLEMALEAFWSFGCGRRRGFQHGFSFAMLSEAWWHGFGLRP